MLTLSSYKKVGGSRFCRTWIAGSQPLPTGPGNSVHSKNTWETMDRETDHLGRITYSILRTPSNSPTVRSSLPLLSVSSPPLPSLIPRDSSPAQTRPCSPCSVSSLAPTLICSQKEHTNSSSVFCIHSLSF